VYNVAGECPDYPDPPANHLVELETAAKRLGELMEEYDEHGSDATNSRVLHKVTYVLALRSGCAAGKRGQGVPSKTAQRLMHLSAQSVWDPTTDVRVICNMSVAGLDTLMHAAASATVKRGEMTEEQYVKPHGKQKRCLHSAVRTVRGWLAAGAAHGGWPDALLNADKNLRKQALQHASRLGRWSVG